MERQIILEFLSKNHQQLSEHFYTQMTLCLLGSHYDQQLATLFNPTDEINIYHIKEPRIYHKKYSFDKLENNIIAMALDVQTEITFNKDELDFDLFDPFYFKKINTLDFGSIQVTPINDKECIGFLITYYQQTNQKVTYDQKCLVRLIKDLFKEHSSNYEKEILNLINKPQVIYYLLKNKQYIYVNDNLKNHLKIPSSVLKTKETSFIGRLDHFSEEIGIKKQKFHDYDLFYLTKFTSETEKPSILASCEINKYLQDSFYLWYLEINQTKNLFEDVFTLFKQIPLEDFKIIQINIDSYWFLINEKVNLSDQNKISLKIPFYNLWLTAPQQVNNKMDFDKIYTYLHTEKPDEFKYDVYVKWLKNSFQYKAQLKNSDELEIINSYDGKFFAKVLNVFSNNDEKIKIFEEDSEEKISKVNLKEQTLFISLTTTSLKKRQTLEKIKKLLLYNELWINVILSEKLSYEEFLKLISKYKCYKVNLSCDSSIFMNILYAPSLPLFDGIYLNKSEYQSIRENEVGFMQNILSYIIKDNMNVFMENFLPSENDLVHTSCYYIKRKEQK